MKIWTELFDEKEIAIRSEGFQNYVDDILSQVVASEQDLHSEMIAQSNEYKEKVLRMQIILKIERDTERPIPKFKNMTEELECYEKILKNLTSLKFQNQGYLKELKAQESHLCQALSENEIDIPNGSVYTLISFELTYF